MDLIQRKLTKSEWEGIEVPVSEDECEILKLIKNGYKDVNIRYNNNPSLIGYMKMGGDDVMVIYLFQEYFADTIKKLIKKYDILTSFPFPSLKKKAQPKKGDLIRIKNINTSSTFPYVGKGMIFEFLLLEVATNLLKSVHIRFRQSLGHFGEPMGGGKKDRVDAPCPHP